MGMKVGLIKTQEDFNMEYEDFEVISSIKNSEVGSTHQPITLENDIIETRSINVL